MNHRTLISRIGILFGLALLTGTAVGSPGLTAGPNATVLKDGRPFRGIGVNYFDCFLRTLKNGGDTSYDAGFVALAADGIPFARFAACGFWPEDMKLYVADRPEYFRRMDGVVRSAEKHGVGLIPSLFWTYACVPDLVGEPMDQWANPASKTRAWMAQYVKEVVTRYRASPAIWMWEIGNEISLAGGLPANPQRPGVKPKLGTPSARGPHDALTFVAIREMFAAIAAEVRKYDPDRLIDSGDNYPRPAAWHLEHEGGWTRDTPEQYAEMLTLANPDPVGAISLHAYNDDDLQRLPLALDVARRLNKPLFVGEFGSRKGDAAFRRLLAAIVDGGIPLAALWVYDFPAQNDTFNAMPGTPRAWWLAAVVEANRKLRQLEAPSSEPVAGLDATSPVAALKPQRLRTEYLENPLGLDGEQPRLSWIVESNRRADRQTGYQVIAASSEALLQTGQGDLWDSGRVASDQTAQVRYTGKPVQSGQRIWWKLRVWDRDGLPSKWSAPAFWEMGLLARSDWHGHWIGRTAYRPTTPEEPLAMPQLRRSFGLEGKVKRARIYLVGLGYFELTINGRRIGDHLLDPGYTRYDRRVLYVTHDVTDALRAGENVVGVLLGNGWFNVEAPDAWDFDQAAWRAAPRLLCELRVEMEDGRTVVIPSDEHWQTADSPITFSGIYGGEAYDARLEQAGWDQPAFDASGWQAAIAVDAPKGRLVAQAMHPIRITKVIKPVAVTSPAPGVFVFDAGQNLTGNATLSLTGPAGTQVSLRYGEKLGASDRIDQSTISVHVLRYDPAQPFQTDRYILNGRGPERWASRFNYNGFRYVEVEGVPGPLTADNLAINFFHSDVPDVGTFESSNPTLNRIWANGRWSYLSNLFGIPTDCPHREKNGWTGDAQIACEQGLFYQDGITVYEKWINDLGDEQWITGALPGIVPTGGRWGYAFGSGPAWDSAFLIVPWHLYQYYGDATALKAHYDGAKRYVDYLTSRARDGIVEIGLGDWSPWKARTPAAITDTTYYYRDARIVAAVARLLGRTDDAKKYDALADGIRESFNRTFFDPHAASYGTGTQAALGAALYQGLVEPKEEGRVTDTLVQTIARNDDHLDYGFLGSKFVPNALSAHGRADLAYAMIVQPTPPSYAWQVAQGATTLWETWSGDGQPKPGQKINGAASQNHTFFGDVNAWMMKNLAGIQPDPGFPGFKHFLIRPEVLGDLTSAAGSYESVRGRISSAWILRGGVFHLEVSVPANTTATVSIPATDAAQIRESGRSIPESEGVTMQSVDRGRAIIEVSSGNYSFVVTPEKHSP